MSPRSELAVHREHQLPERRLRRRAAHVAAPRIAAAFAAARGERERVVEDLDAPAAELRKLELEQWGLWYEWPSYRSSINLDHLRALYSREFEGEERHGAAATCAKK